MITVNMYVQITSLVTSGLALWFISRDAKYSKHGYVIGLIGQPLWIWSTYQHKQWGMFALSIWYGLCYLQGVYLTFIKDRQGITTLCKDHTNKGYVKILRRSDGTVIKIVPIEKAEYNNTAKRMMNLRMNKNINREIKKSGG